MNDHNLDDLIIDTTAPKNNKTKGLLTITALFIVVLIVAIILTRTLLKSPENSELHFEENLSDMIAPELKLQEPTKEIKIAKPRDELSLPTVIEEKIQASKEEEIKAPEVSNEITTPKVTEQVPPKVVKEPTVATPKVTKPVRKHIVKPKVQVKKPITKPTKKSVTTPNSTASGTYYVQVGSFKENPSKRFLSVIKSSGFAYHVTSPDRTGYKKLLIGPYKTRADVDKARDVIRDRIHKSAFVVEK